QTSFATGNSDSVSSGPKTTMVDGELIFGYACLLNNATAGPDFTALSLANGDLDEYQVQTTAGPVASTFRQTSGAWLAMMATFIPTGAQSISGTISPATAGSSATVTLSGTKSATVSADASGNYAFGGLSNGNYTVTPSKSGFAFTPSNQVVTINGANVG